MITSSNLTFNPRTSLLLLLTLLTLSITLFTLSSSTPVWRPSALSLSHDDDEFMPLLIPGWKTGDRETDNTLHVVGGEGGRRPVVDVKGGGEGEYAPPGKEGVKFRA